VTIDQLVPSVEEDTGARVREEEFPRGRSSASFLVWLRIVARRRRLVFSVAAVVAALGVVTAILLPDQYTAKVVLLPPQQQQPGLGGAAMLAQLSMGAAGSAALGLKNPNDQQVALLKSRPVEDAIIQRFNLKSVYHKKRDSAARRKWEKVSSADAGLKDGLIRLAVTDRDPRRAADMANAWVEEYRRFTANLAVMEASQRRLFFQQQVEAAHEDLVRAEDELGRVQQRTGVIDIEGQDRMMIASAAELRGQLAAKQIQIRGMREFAAPGNPDLQRAEQESNELQAKLAEMDAANDHRQGDLIVPKGKVTQTGLDYLRAMREVKYRETLQDLLLRQYEGARVEEARQGALIQIVEAAAVPDHPDMGRKLLIPIAALLLALPLGLLAALAAELLNILRNSRRRAGSWMDALEEVLGTW